MSQSALAKKVSAQGISFHQPTVQRIEAGERPVRLDEARVIAEVLESSVTAMTASSSDETVDATMAVDRVTRLAEVLNGDVSGWTDDWESSFLELSTLLGDLMRSNPVPTALVCWVGAWNVRALALEDAFEATLVAARNFDPEYDFDSDVWGNVGEPLGAYQAKDYLGDRGYWERAPKGWDPRELAKLATHELYTWARVHADGADE